MTIVNTVLSDGPQEPDVLVDEAELSRLSGVPRRTLQAWRLGIGRGGPRFQFVGSRVRYQVGESLAWIERNYLPRRPARQRLRAVG